METNIKETVDQHSTEFNIKSFTHVGSKGQVIPWQVYVGNFDFQFNFKLFSLGDDVIVYGSQVADVHWSWPFVCLVSCSSDVIQDDLSQQDTSLLTLGYYFHWFCSSEEMFREEMTFNVNHLKGRYMCKYIKQEPETITFRVPDRIIRHLV